MDLPTTPLDPNRRPIPGIYNYCDRWCERCPFADRCAVHAAMRHLEIHSPTERLLTHLRGRFGMIAARRDGHTVADAGAWREPAVDAAAAPPQAGTDALQHEARRYAALVDAWFETESATLCDRADELARVCGVRGVDRSGRRESASSLRTAPGSADLELVIAALEIVRHDAWLIPVKLARALHPGGDGEPGISAHVQNDRNGSAKVALLAMDRSEAAWRILDEWLPSGSAALLTGRLVALRVATERAFPHARRFLRPGFDGVLPSEGEA
jgi:hypothetical protein